MPAAAPCRKLEPWRCPIARRTIAIGDIHGQLALLEVLFERIPELNADDTLVLLGDYVDRGPRSAQVISFIRVQLPHRTPARVVALRGNHEDAWLRAIDRGFPQFVLPEKNGCRECMESFVGQGPPEPESEAWYEELFSGAFFPPPVVAWMRQLPAWHEDEHAIYVHGGLLRDGERWLHPSDVQNPSPMLWMRDETFFRDYRGKPVVCGHTPTSVLPQELSSYTPDDPDDVWVGPSVIGLDTGSGKGGFLTALELPGGAIYESR